MKKSDLELCYLTATDALDKFKRRELSPVELCQALIERNEEVGSKLNATTYTFFERALKAARAAEARYKPRKGRRPRPLEGVPIAIKDFHSIKGEITTYGSRIFSGHKPTQPAPTVDRLLKAGAILFARTTTPEFAHSGVTRSPLWGITRNPWDFELHARWIVWRRERRHCRRSAATPWTANTRSKIYYIMGPLPARSPMLP